jgi:hypothetical protein
MVEFKMILRKIRGKLTRKLTRILHEGGGTNYLYK